METKAAMSRANAVMINSFEFPLCFIYVLFSFHCQSHLRRTVGIAISAGFHPWPSLQMADEHSKGTVTSLSGHTAANKKARTLAPGLSTLVLEKGSLVASVLETLAGRELRHVTCRNINFLAGLRVAALGGFATRYGEVAKADQTDVAAILQLTGNGFKNGFDSRSSITLAEARFLGHSSHEFILVHFRPFLALCRLITFDAVILRISRSRATKLPGNPGFIKAFHRENVTLRFGKHAKRSKIIVDWQCTVPFRDTRLQSCSFGYENGRDILPPVTSINQDQA